VSVQCYHQDITVDVLVNVTQLFRCKSSLARRRGISSWVFSAVVVHGVFRNVEQQLFLLKLLCVYCKTFNFGIEIILAPLILAFLPARRYASAGNSDRNVSVRPSVRLSRAGIVSKQRKLAA